MYAQETGEAFLILLTIDHEDFASPTRVVNNTENVTSSREITQAIRLVSEPPTVDISVIRAADPDNPEVVLPTFTLRNVSWDALTITGDLVLRDITTEPYPQYVFDPGRFPGLVVSRVRRGEPRHP